MNYYDGNVSEYFSRCRKESGMTQAEIGEYLNTAPSTVSDSERGLREPSLDVFAKICTMFGLQPDAVLSNGRANHVMALDSDEEELIREYRKCSKEMKDLVLRAAGTGSHRSL